MANTNDIRTALLAQMRAGTITLGEFVRQLRKKHLRMTQRDLGKHCSVATGTLAALEQEAERITLGNLNAILAAVDLELRIADQAPGHGVRTLRKKHHKLTQVELAEKADVAPGTLLALEKGKDQISLGNLNKLLFTLDSDFSIEDVTTSTDEAADDCSATSGSAASPSRKTAPVRLNGDRGMSLDSRAPSMSDILWPHGKNLNARHYV